MTASRKNSHFVVPGNTVDKVIAKNTSLYREWLIQRFPGYKTVGDGLNLSKSSNSKVESTKTPIKR